METARSACAGPVHRAARGDRRRTALSWLDDAGPLIQAARRGAASAPSRRTRRFKVGAALETADGTIVTGLQHRERHLRPDGVRRARGGVQGRLGGVRAFRRIAVVADTQDPTPPCGPCRQILWEFCGDIEVILANLTEEKGRYRLKDLLPLPFDARLLGIDG